MTLDLKLYAVEVSLLSRI